MLSDDLAKYLKEPSWAAELKEEFEKPYFKELQSQLKKKYDEGIAIYPPKNKIFEALNLTPLSEVRAVILGQDPYHRPNQAHGLSFSVQKGVAFPPSLRNILMELSTCFKIKIPQSGDLSPWAKQGVLLLNSVLTVEEGQPNSHREKGWEIFTDRIIQIVEKKKTKVVFVLWGSYAQKKAAFIDTNKHLVIESPHPSPLSSYRGFFGSQPFLKANKYLKAQGKKPIDWSL